MSTPWENYQPSNVCELLINFLQKNVVNQEIYNSWVKSFEEYGIDTGDSNITDGLVLRLGDREFKLTVERNSY